MGSWNVWLIFTAIVAIAMAVSYALGQESEKRKKEITERERRERQKREDTEKNRGARIKNALDRHNLQALAGKFDICGVWDEALGYHLDVYRHGKPKSLGAYRMHLSIDCRRGLNPIQLMRGGPNPLEFGLDDTSIELAIREAKNYMDVLSAY